MRLKELPMPDLDLIKQGELVAVSEARSVAPPGGLAAAATT